MGSRNLPARSPHRRGSFDSRFPETSGSVPVRYWDENAQICISGPVPRQQISLTRPSFARTYGRVHYPARAKAPRPVRRPPHRIRVQADTRGPICRSGLMPTHGRFPVDHRQHVLPHTRLPEPRLQCSISYCRSNADVSKVLEGCA